MQIDKDYLKRELASLEQQRANALAVAQQALGAMALIQSLMARLDEPEAETKQ